MKNITIPKKRFIKKYFLVKPENKILRLGFSSSVNFLKNLICPTCIHPTNTNAITARHPNSQWQDLDNHAAPNKMIAKGTIEEKIVKLQETKKDLADSIISGENIGISNLSKEDLMELLGI